MGSTNLIVVLLLIYQKLEEQVEKEHQFHMERTAVENKRRREKREHEMNMLRTIMGPQPSSSLLN